MLSDRSWFCSGQRRWQWGCSDKYTAAGERGIENSLFLLDWPRMPLAYFSTQWAVKTNKQSGVLSGQLGLCSALTFVYHQRWAQTELQSSPVAWQSLIMLCACSAKLFSLLIPEAVVREGMRGRGGCIPLPTDWNMGQIFPVLESWFAGQKISFTSVCARNIHWNIAQILGRYPGPKAVICYVWPWEV